MSMGTNAHLTTAQGLYIPNNPTHMGSNGMDLGNTASGDYSIAIGSSFAMGGSTNSTTTYIDKLELKMYKQSIRIIQLENKLDSEECENLKKMLISNDEASVILAKEIIDNLETA
jgi:hypothetical protein